MHDTLLIEYLFYYLFKYLLILEWALSQGVDLGIVSLSVTLGYMAGDIMHYLLTKKPNSKRDSIQKNGNKD